MPDITSYCSAFKGLEFDYCIALAKQCDDPAKHFTVDSFDKSTYKAADKDSCIGYAQFRVTLGVPPTFSDQSKPQTNTPTDHQTGEKPTQPKAPPADQKPGVAPSKHNDTPSDQKPGKEPKRSPYIPREKALAKKDTASDKASSNAPATNPKPRENHVANSDESAKHEPLKQPKRNPLDVDSSAPFRPDGVNRLACSFEKINFDPIVSDDVTITTLGLKFPTKQGIRIAKIDIAYIVEQTAEGYKLRYSIFESRRPEKVQVDELTEEVPFTVEGNMITTNLAFAVIVSEPYDLNSRGKIKVAAIR